MGPSSATGRASSLPDFRAYSFPPMQHAAAALHGERISHPMSEPLQVRCRLLGLSQALQYHFVSRVSN